MTVGRRPIIVTWCVARKSVSGGVRFESASGSRAERAAAWLLTLRGVAPAAPARDLYAGRAFRLAREAAQRYDADLSVVSAGLGWVTAGTIIPAYDVTVGLGGLDGNGEDIDLGAWWRSVVAGPFSTPPERDLAGRPLVLACIANAYAPFFSESLASVPRAQLRIFGSGLARRLTPDLSEVMMPYDDRLNVVMPGTRADFAQRALHHYLFTLRPSTDVEADKARVAASLEGVKKPHVRSGRSVSDDDVRALIRATAAESSLARTAMLRHFRDVLGVACEQSRFARLYAEEFQGGR